MAPIPVLSPLAYLTPTTTSQAVALIYTQETPREQSYKMLAPVLSAHFLRFLEVVSQSPAEVEYASKASCFADAPLVVLGFVPVEQHLV